MNMNWENPQWTEAQDLRLLKLAAEGNTASAIAAEFDKSRNAIIGRIYRLGGKLISRKRPEGAAPPRCRLKGRPPPEKRRPVIKIESRKLTLPELRQSHCRFPDSLDISERIDDMRYCGHKAAPDSPYCAHHHKIAYGNLPAATGRSFILAKPGRSARADAVQRGKQ